MSMMFIPHNNTTGITNLILNEDCPTVKAPHRAKFMSVTGRNLTSKLNSFMFNTDQNLDLEPIPQSLFPNTTEAHPYLFTSGPSGRCTVVSREHGTNHHLFTAFLYRGGLNSRDNLHGPIQQQRMHQQLKGEQKPRSEDGSCWLVVGTGEQRSPPPHGPAQQC